MYTHTHTSTIEYYSATKKNEILPFATTWIDLQGIKLSEISYIEKDKYCMIYVESKNTTNHWNITKNKLDKLSLRHREQISGFQWGKVGRGNIRVAE